MITNKQPLHGIGMTSNRTRQRLIDRLKSQGIKNSIVLNTIAETPRHVFIDEALSHRAYDDTSLPIGLGQTISQPYIVAKMTELLLQEPKPQRILEIGTGSGYQCAILAKLFKEVFTIERLAKLSGIAKQRLAMLGIHNIRYKVGNGAEGWEVHGPFDAIIITAAAENMPEKLLKQVKIGGRIILPLGSHTQCLHELVRTGPNEYDDIEHEAVKFVPLIEA